MVTGEITKNGTLAKTLNKPVGGSNPYVWFGYSPLKLFNHTQRQVSVSTNDDTISMVHTSQQSTKDVFSKELEGYFRSSTLKLKRTIIYE